MESSYSSNPHNSLNVKRTNDLGQSHHKSNVESMILQSITPRAYEDIMESNMQKFRLIKRPKRLDNNIKMPVENSNEGISFLYNRNKINGLIKMSQLDSYCSKKQGKFDGIRLENNPLLVSIGKIHSNVLHYNRLNKAKESNGIKALPLINSTYKEVVMSKEEIESNKVLNRKKLKKMSLEDIEETKVVSLKKNKRYCLTSNQTHKDLNMQKNTNQIVNDNNNDCNGNDDSFIAEIASLFDVGNKDISCNSRNEIKNNILNNNLQIMQSKEIPRDHLDQISRINNQRPGTSYGSASLRKLNNQNSRHSKNSLLSSS